MIPKTILFSLFIIFQLNIYGQSMFEDWHKSASDSLNNDKKLSLHGKLDSKLAALGECYDFNAIFTELRLNTSLELSNTYFFAEGKWRTGWIYDEKTSSFVLREAYVGYSGTKLSLFLGNQIKNWGKAEGFNPTNNLNPIEYFLPGSDQLDRTIPNFMLSLDYEINDHLRLEGIFIPVYKSSIYRFDLITPGEFIHYMETELPSMILKNGSYALKAESVYPGWSLGLSFFNGYDPYCGFHLDHFEQSTSETEIYYQVKPYRRTSIGMDVEILWPAMISRLEIAYNHSKEFKINAEIPSPHFYYVFNLERPILGFTTILQYIGKYTLNFEELTVPILPDPNDPTALYQYYVQSLEYETQKFNRKLFYQEQEFNHALSLILQRSILYDKLDLELMAYFNLSSEEWFIFPTIKWNISDLFKLNVSYNYMEGGEHDLFDYTGPVMNGALLEFIAKF